MEKSAIETRCPHLFAQLLATGTVLAIQRNRLTSGDVECYVLLASDAFKGGNYVSGKWCGIDGQFVFSIRWLLDRMLGAKQPSRLFAFDVRLENFPCSDTANPVEWLVTPEEARRRTVANIDP
jgi:hypothetical protein